MPTKTTPNPGANPLRQTTSQLGSAATARLICGALIVALVGVLGVGCAGSEDVREDVDPGDTLQERARNGNLSTSGLDVRKADLNGNGEADQWTFINDSTGNVVRVERDLNFNGRVDMWQYFDASGELIEEEMDLGYDGLVDVVVIYSGGVVSRKMLATAFDGTFAIQKFYNQDGQLLRVERDSSGDGAADVWEYFEKGERVRIGWDTSGDGRADTFDQLN